MSSASRKFILTTPGDREIQFSREFAAPRALVFDAFTQPEMIRCWLLGPPGWSMPICEVDLRVGGKYRYVWRNVDGREMGMGGIYREIVASERIVATEKFDESWYPGEALCTLRFTEQASRTTLTQTMRYESKAARDTALASEMESGISASYDRLEQVVLPKQSR